MPAAPEVVAPAFLWTPEHTSSAGAEAADLAASVGLILDAEQRLAIDALLAEGPDGRWAAFEAAVIAARQNLKTFLFEVVVLADIYLFGSELVVWTAHEFNTAMEAFRDVKQIIEGAPHLSKRVKRVLEANGEEGIEFTSGQRLRFKARTKSGGRGLTGDRVILDEAFALQPTHMGSLMPTMSAKSVDGNPQILYGSSAGKPESAVLRGIRDRGRRGGDNGLVYVEWCAPQRACGSDHCDHRVDAADCVLDDVDMWRQANPAMGRRISVEWIANERRSLPPEEFARERLGWWEDPEDAADGLPLDVWNDCADPVSQMVSVDCWAVAPADDLSWCAIAAAGLRADGIAHMEVVEYRKGTSWVADRMVELKAEHGGNRVVLEGRGPRSALFDDLCEVGLSPQLASSVDLTDACGVLFDRLLRRTVRHIAQPELDVSVKGGRRRFVGDAWVWARRGSTVEISPVIAATLALWGAREHPVDVAENVW